MEINSFFKKWRIIFFISCVGALTLTVVFSYFILALKPYSSTVLEPQKSERGTILDRNGKVLAIQNSVYNIALTPSAILDKNAFAQILSPVIALTQAQIVAAIERAPSNFLYLKKRISQSEADEIEAVRKTNDLRGIRLEKNISRSYPEKALASQVIGFMGDSGDGLSGIEYSFQKILAPSLIQNELFNTKNAYGKNIVLTLDAALQYRLEQTARAALEQTQAESFMLIAAEAKTGEILSYISLPSADLNDYRLSTVEEQIDRPAITAYEPGSVFKIFSTAAFIDSGAVKSDDLFNCTGGFEVKSASGENVRINCLGNHGWITAREALQYSCNDVLAQMSQRITSEAFINRLRAFGFGSKTGIELPGETAGTVKMPNDRMWSARSKPTISIGQEISVSALQMVQAATALTNGGKGVKLTLLSKIIDRTGKVDFSHEPKVLPQIISAKTAQYLLSCMETTASLGTGSRASINDVKLGVKTGTAQMIDIQTGKYSTTDFISNCIAVFPIEQPRIILYIVITKAKGETLAGRIVAPVIAQTADIIIDHLGLARNNATAVTHSGTVTVVKGNNITVSKNVPNFIGLPKRSLLPLLERTDLNVKINGDGWVFSQNPAAGTPVTENMLIELNLR